ncbi:hypothetical protein L5515_017352 [Caenorhabditis briggsae]|nr:hypothetical protein L5515_017352 [Caenorhabditis briggsae]
MHCGDVFCQTCSTMSSNVPTLYASRFNSCALVTTIVRTLTRHPVNAEWLNAISDCEPTNFLKEKLSMCCSLSGSLDCGSYQFEVSTKNV